MYIFSMRLEVAVRSSLYIYIYINMYNMYICIYDNICIYVYMYICIYVYMYICIYVSMYMYIHYTATPKLGW